MTNLGPEGWRPLALGELDRALTAGANTLAGMYHGCQRQFCAFEAERPIAIEHYLTVFARALGIGFEDTLKKYVRPAGRGDVRPRRRDVAALAHGSRHSSDRPSHCAR